MHTATNICEKPICSAHPHFKSAHYHVPSCKIHLLGHEASVQPCKTIPASPSKCALPAKKGHVHIPVQHSWGGVKHQNPLTPRRGLTMGAGHSTGHFLFKALPVQSNNTTTYIQNTFRQCPFCSHFKQHPFTTLSGSSQIMVQLALTGTPFDISEWPA